MIKKLDKLLLGSFFGPFILTFLVVDFILLIQYMLRYFDEFVGKDLGFMVFAEMIGYFSINMTPIALPLAVLLSSLMTYGNLGEHFELTAIKSSGISLLRTLRPLGAFVVLLSIGAYFSNNYLVPKANLKAYRLLYDIRQTKPALDIREGIFYNGIPSYSIKVNKKYPDDISLKELIIYDHSKGIGNMKVVMADSGRMYTIEDGAYLKLELFNGHHYAESLPNRGRVKVNQLTRNEFEKSVMLFDLSSFAKKETDEDLFKTNKRMLTAQEIQYEIDSMELEDFDLRYKVLDNASVYYTYHMKRDWSMPARYEERRKDIDSLRRASLVDSAEIAEYNKMIAARDKSQILPELYGSKDSVFHALDSAAYARALKAMDKWLDNPNRERRYYKSALNNARNIKNTITTLNNRIERVDENINKYAIEKFNKSAHAFACIVMFLIGAPVGAIIKRGGLGIPVILSIVFFIIFYVLSIVGTKWAKVGITDPFTGVWAANFILLPVGIFFLWQARNDVRLFESDFYFVLYNKIRQKLSKAKKTAA